MLDTTAHLPELMHAAGGTELMRAAPQLGGTAQQLGSTACCSPMQLHAQVAMWKCSQNASWRRIAY